MTVLSPPAETPLQLNVGPSPSVETGVSTHPSSVSGEISSPAVQTTLTSSPEYHPFAPGVSDMSYSRSGFVASTFTDSVSSAVPAGDVAEQLTTVPPVE